jgi:hypothetical protein
MTPNDLALLLSPQVKEALELSKDDILATLQPIQRVFVRALWPIVVNQGAPLATLVIIELAIAKYQTYLAPSISPFVASLIESMNEEKVPQLALLQDILSVLQTPTSQFHPVVQKCLQQEAVNYKSPES